MNFKEIELAGFKSFADHTQIKFDKGITAIVGPNGCGKSNVSDAIRWVLGEQSSKLLRGSSMQDVIFNGTEKRKSLSYCEVTLVFDNADRFFKYDNDEIAITRKLYRSGESAYLINRNPCRLKDIVNILYDSGLGRDGYSIIGQGKVEEIISSKPENRRSIFEDAAGISKYKSRKVEAERKLERTQENLTRLNDILSELERQMGPLKRQAENAKKYLEFRNSLKDLEINAYIFKYDNANVVKGEIKKKLDAIQEELELRQTELAKCAQEYDKCMENISSLDEKIAKAHSEILRLTVELEKQSGEAKLIREKINHMVENKNKVRIDLLNAQNAVQKDEVELSVKQDVLKDIETKLKQLNLSYDEMSDNYLKIIDELNLHEGEAENSQQRMLDALERITDIKANFSRYEAEKNVLEQNLADVDKKLEEKSLEANAKQKQLQDIELNVSKLKQQQSKCQGDIADAKFGQESLAGQIKDEQEERYKLNSKCQVYENQKRFLEEMQKEYDGYAYAVKKLLKESQKNSALKSKMVGVLASLISVPEKYEIAVETALGNAVQNIVTFDENNAKELISYLKENQFGRATFLPITMMKPKKITEEDKKALNINGCFGIASDLISYENNIANVVSNLLGSTIIVDTLDTAIYITNKTKLSYKIVTLDGDIINPTGSMTGGSRKNEAANLISRDREIKTLAQEIEKIHMQVKQKSENIIVLTKKHEELKANMNSLLNAQSQAQVAFATENERLATFTNALNQILDEKQALEVQKAQLSSQIDYLRQELSSIDELENTAMENKTTANKAISERQEKYNALKEKRDEYNTQMTTIRVEIASLEAQQKSFAGDVERINEDIENQNKLAKAFEVEIENIDKLIEESEKIIKIQIETDANQETKQELLSMKQKQQDFEQQKTQSQENVKVLNDKKDKIVEEISKVTDRKYFQEAQLDKVDTDIEQMQERIYEEYELTYSTCQEFKRPDFDIEIAMPEINNLKKEIQKLGYVNVNAIEDVKVLLERYNDLKVQSDDLIKAQTDLESIISELSEEMITKFKSEFDKINSNFKITFRELFGGGNARLELTDPDNLLESGVDIVAEPPGKKLQNITLLSGGEKALTAIAILFAILKLKPMPFCLLDEIEAALDDSNVGRFAEYLKRFSNVTQFIVITHRKPTMELADSLFGVTMQEKGVSRMVSVKLSEAIKNVEVK
ncbi:MAG: chromosome segregation protein SMC [Clostridia bacterium]|nr:chromosome segregation protein SMC [Clostridia bacterium]